MVRNKLHRAQMTQWNFQNKGKSGWTGTSSFVLEVPLRYLRPSVIYSVPCDQILLKSLFTLRTEPWSITTWKKFILDTLTSYVITADWTTNSGISGAWKLKDMNGISNEKFLLYHWQWTHGMTPKLTIIVISSFTIVSTAMEDALAQSPWTLEALESFLNHSYILVA